MRGACVADRGGGGGGGDLFMMGIDARQDGCYYYEDASVKTPRRAGAHAVCDGGDAQSIKYFRIAGDKCYGGGQWENTRQARARRRRGAR